MITTSNNAAPLPRQMLVLGGARSGKSHYAEQLIETSGLAPFYLATAEALDGEMTGRIAKHRERRGPNWQTIEEPLALVEAMSAVSADGRAILVDCLTLWLTNLMVAERAVDVEIDRLIASLDDLDGVTIFVSNEVGQGITPMNKMGRDFIDHAGFLHQRLAAKADSVLLMTAGLAQQLKP